ncbi:MAG: hypothetical protein LBO06_07830 [Bacteroidales bacterium]|jgi:hypothetical protein|nr:hypothetical protein [Bacteroidales bacterium]
MKTIEKIIGLNKKSKRMVLCLLMAVVVSVGFIACGEDPDPAPLPVPPFPSPLAPSMVGTAWANANTLPNGTPYHIGYDSTGAGISVGVNLREYYLLFKDSVNLEVQAKFSNTDSVVAIEKHNFHYTFDRYGCKGQIKASTVGGLTMNFYIYIGNVADGMKLVCNDLGNEFEQQTK